MADNPSHPRLAGLYLRLSAWLIPTFLLLAILGLSILARHIATDVERQVTMRVGNIVARVAGGLEAMADDLAGDQASFSAAGQQIILTLMSDPAIECAELRDLDGQVILAAPRGLGCHPSIAGEQVSLPLYLEEDSDLVAVWNLREVDAARSRQREISMAILIFGLMVALLTNWLAFRTIIGKPLHDLVSRVERARQDAEHNSLHDSLTGLPNRRHLDLELSRRSSSSERLTVLHMDLDGFKPINDTLGHAAGDLVLRRVADSLKKLVPPEDFVARAGGDEFVVISSKFSSEGDATSLAEQLINHLCEPVRFDGEYCRIGASIGIALDQDATGQTPSDDILGNADIALYKAKALGRGKWVVFSAAMRAETEKRRRLVDEMHSALENGEFIAHYQTQVCPHGLQLVGLEALVRWQHPRLGLLNPGQFIGVAEESALVDRIDHEILRCAINDLERWSEMGLNVPSISVNLSAKRLNSPGLLSDLQALSIPRGKIVFEVLESAFLDKVPDTTLWNIDGVADMGIEIEIDDFGTGHASIASVLALRPTRIKVAREIVQSYANQTANRELLEAIVAMGRSMGVGLIAEGVETPEHVSMIRDLGFEKLQGFAFSKPAPAERITPQLLNSSLAQGTANTALG